MGDQSLEGADQNRNDTGKPSNPNGLTDVSGEFRIGDITLKLHGDNLMLTRRGIEKEVSEGELEGFLHENFFVDKEHAKR